MTDHTVDIPRSSDTPVDSVPTTNPVLDDPVPVEPVPIVPASGDPVPVDPVPVPVDPVPVDLVPTSRPRAPRTPAREETLNRLSEAVTRMRAERLRREPGSEPRSILRRPNRNNDSNEARPGLRRVHFVEHNIDPSVFEDAESDTTNPAPTPAAGASSVRATNGTVASTMDGSSTSEASTQTPNAGLRTSGASALTTLTGPSTSGALNAFGPSATAPTSRSGTADASTQTPNSAIGSSAASAPTPRTSYQTPIPGPRVLVTNNDFLPGYGRTGDSERSGKSKQKPNAYSAFMIYKQLMHKAEAEDRGENTPMLSLPAIMALYDSEWKEMTDEKAKWKMLAKYNTGKPLEKQEIHWGELPDGLLEPPRAAAAQRAPLTRRAIPSHMYKAPPMILGEVFEYNPKDPPQDKFLHGSAEMRERVPSEYKLEKFALMMRLKLAAEEATAANTPLPNETADEASDPNMTIDSSYVSSEVSTDISTDTEEGDTTTDNEAGDSTGDATYDSMPTLEEVSINDSMAGLGIDSEKEKPQSKSSSASPANSPASPEVSPVGSPAKSNESSVVSSPDKTSTSSSSESSPNKSSSDSDSSSTFLGASEIMEASLALISERIQWKKNKEASGEITSDESDANISPKKGASKETSSEEETGGEDTKNASMTKGDSESETSSEEESCGEDSKDKYMEKGDSGAKEESSEQGSSCEFQEEYPKGEPSKPSSSTTSQTDARAQAVSKMADSLAQMAAAMTQMMAMAEKMTRD